MTFELTETQQQLIREFYLKCKKKLKGKDVHISYHFYPTGIGTVVKVKVKSETLNKELDITDLNDW